MSAKSGKVLTAKIAEKAVAQEHCDLNEYTEIEDAAGEILAEYEGYIQLDGIHQLSENLARSFASHKGGLSLSGIESLTEETAALLSKGKGSLSLNGLSTLSKNAALHLIQRPGPLYLNGLKDISEELLKILASHKEALALVSFTKLSPENARILSEHQGGGLFLGSLKVLSPEIARILAKHTDHLALEIKDVSDEVFEIFGEREEGAYITSLYDITEVAKAKYSDDREFIVSLSFEYCDVNYKGYRIMTKREIRNLVAALNTDVKIGTPNMPGSWYEEFDIALLKDAFEIHSPWPSYIQAMRKAFFGEESIGETSLFDRVLEHAPGSNE